ncbi:hypothetical protein AVEN_79683-1, partial [Araneus ventricosus]
WPDGLGLVSDSDWSLASLIGMADGLLRSLCEGGEKIKLLARLGPRDKASKLGNFSFGE